MNEQQLHAYVDDALSEAERREVEAYLAQHADDAARVRAWLQQKEALHRLFDRVLDEPHTLGVGMRSARSASENLRRWIGAALAAALLLGVAIGWLANDRWPDAITTQRITIARQAALAHAAYVPEVRHPVEVGAQDRDHLLAWLSKRLQMPLHAPSLTSAGYNLLGGRLLPAAGAVGDAPVALLLYENNQGRRLSLLIRRETTPTETALRYAQSGTTRVFYWIDGPIGCALAGDLDRKELAHIAHLAYQQISP